jgi:hypothetical protein
MASMHDTTRPPSANPRPARVEAARPGATARHAPAAGCHGPSSGSPASSAGLRLYNLARPDTRGRAVVRPLQHNTTSMSPGTATATFTFTFTFTFVLLPATLGACPSMPERARQYNILQPEQDRPSLSTGCCDVSRQSGLSLAFPPSSSLPVSVSKLLFRACYCCPSTAPPIKSSRLVRPANRRQQLMPLLPCHGRELCHCHAYPHAAMSLTPVLLFPAGLAIV